MVNIAVIIDCYHNDSGKMSPTDLFQYNIVDTINKLDLDHVYVCSYDIPLSELNSKNQFYRNTRKLLTEEQWKKKELFLSKPDLPIRETSKIILDPNLYKKDIGISTAHLPMEIDYQKVKKVYMFGDAFDVCLMHRPLGIPFWIEQKDCEVLVTEKSTRYANLTYVDYDMLPNCVLQKDIDPTQYKIEFLFEW